MMGSTIGHRIEYNRVGALRGQRHIPSQNLSKYPPTPLPGSSGRCGRELSLFEAETEAEAERMAFESAGYRFQLVVLEIGPLNYSMQHRIGF